MPVRYILSSVWVRSGIFSQSSIIQHMGLSVFISLPISRVIEIIYTYIYTLSYYHHEIGSMSYYPLFRVRSWNNDVRCMSFCILIIAGCGLLMRRECQKRFPRYHGLAIPTCITSTCVSRVPWCMAGSQTGGFVWSRWRGKRPRHSRRMGNPQFHTSGKRPIEHPDLNIYSKHYQISVRKEDIRF